MLCISYMCYEWGTSECPHLCTSIQYIGIQWTYYAEIWWVIKPINYAFYAALGRGHLHVGKCNCTSF